MKDSWVLANSPRCRVNVSVYRASTFVKDKSGVDPWPGSRLRSPAPMGRYERHSGRSKMRPHALMSHPQQTITYPRSLTCVCYSAEGQRNNAWRALRCVTSRALTSILVVISQGTALGSPILPHRPSLKSQFNSCGIWWWAQNVRKLIGVSFFNINFHPLDRQLEVVGPSQARSKKVTL